MRTGIIGLAAAGIVIAGTAAGFAATAPATDMTARTAVLGTAATPAGDLVIARRGADDPPGDDRGGRGRGKDDKGNDDKGGSGKGKGGKGRGGHDDGPNHT